MSVEKLFNRKDIIDVLNSNSVEERRDILDYLLTLDDIADYVEEVCNCIADEDKGIRNSASMLIINNQPGEAAKHIVKFVSSKNITLRNLAGEILIKLGAKAVDTLIQYNCEKNDDDQKFMIDVLGLIGSESAAEHILSILSTTENDNVVLACIEALGNIRYDNAVEILLLLYDRSELYKPSVVEALGKIGSAKASRFLLDKYPAEDELTKYSILESLGYLGDVDTYFFLLEQVVDIHGPLVWPLITSIFILKEKYGLDIPFDDKMKNLLMYTLQEGTAEHKKIALSLINVFNDKDILLESLKYIGEDDELDEIIRSKIYRNPEYLFEEINKILVENPDKLRQLLNLFYSVLTFVCTDNGQLNISLIQKRNIIHGISEYLDHHDEEVRRAGMEILFVLDFESAILFVDSMVQDENIWNRLRLVELLEFTDNQEANDALEKLSKDEDEMVRERVDQILSSRKQNEIYPITK